jgi:Fe-S-cluster formation regulator IscX/YfhJ
MLWLPVLQAVQDLCAHKYGEKVYDRLKQQLDTHIHSVISSLSQHLEDPKAFLNAVCQAWLDHCTHMVADAVV